MLNNKNCTIMKKDLNEIVNKIYVINYYYKLGEIHMTSYLSEKRAREHMQYLIDHGATGTQIHEINLWME